MVDVFFDAAKLDAAASGFAGEGAQACREPSLPCLRRLRSQQHGRTADDVAAPVRDATDAEAAPAKADRRTRVAPQRAASSARDATRSDHSEVAKPDGDGVRPGKAPKPVRGAGVVGSTRAGTRPRPPPSGAVKPARAAQLAKPSRSAAGTADGSGAARRSATAREAVQTLLKSASQEALDAAVKLVGAPSPDVLDERMWGPPPSQEEVAAAVLANLRKQFKLRASLGEQSLSRTNAAGLLGTSEQAITNQLDKRRLVGFKQGREWRIPAWQFNADTDKGIVPGLVALAQAFPGGPVSLSAWAVRPTPDLGNRTPAAALASGAVDEVVSLAGRLTAAGW